MPIAKDGNREIHYETSGGSDREALILLNSLGSTLRMWDKVVPDLESSFRILRYDMRGHGAGFAPPGPYTIEQLGGDLIFLMDELGIERSHLCGLSLGGQVALWMGIKAPQRAHRIVLANTAARIGTSEAWNDRIANIRRSGMAPLALTTLERWFTPKYRQEHSPEMEIVRQMIAATGINGYAGCCAALRDSDLSSSVASIESPCLVITGTHDPAAPPEDGRSLHAALRQSTYVELNSSHLSAWEKPGEFASAVLTFLLQEEQADG